VQSISSSRGGAPDNFAVEMRAAGRWVVVRIFGDADGSRVDQLERFLRRRVMRSVDRRGVEVDLAKVTFLDRRMLGVLLSLRAELLMKGRPVRFVTPSPAAARLLAAMGLDRVLDLTDGSPADAVSGGAGEGAARVGGARRAR
jgi:anti-anti-sigma factor